MVGFWSMRLRCRRRWLDVAQVALGLHAGVGIALAAPPPNDAFASAAVIPSALPAEVSGANVDATEEPGEPLPSDGRRSVWWTWMPQAAGWVKIATASEIDTVLAVYVGDALSGLEIRAFNDDARNVVAGPSAVWVFAAAGEPQRIQVCGYGGEAGAVALRIESAPSPPAITGLSFTPAAADITTDQVGVVAGFSCASAVAVTSAALSVHPPGDLNRSVLGTSVARSGGTDTDGTYRAVFTVPRYLAGGLYPALITLYTAAGEVFTFGENTSRPPGMPGALEIINTGITDTEPPVLADLAASPGSTVDVTSVEQTVQLTARLVDRLAGISDFSCRLLLGSTHSVLDLTNTFSFRTRQSGDNFDGTYHFSVTIPAGSPPGILPLRFDLRDSLGNTVFHGPDSENGEVPLPAGQPTAIVVVNTGDVDTQAPVMTSAETTPGTVNVAAFESCELRVGVTDSLSGVAGVELLGSSGGMRPLGGGPVIHVGAEFERVSGTATSGVWRTIVFPTRTTPPGAYEWVGLRVVDALGNATIYGPASLGFTPFPAGVSPQVVITSQAPDTPYAIWLAKYPSLTGADALRAADPDGDGYPNLVELALGLDPTQSSTPDGPDPNRALAPRVTITANQLSIAYKLATENLGDGPFRIHVAARESTDLIRWDGAQVILDDVLEAFTSIVKGQVKYLRLDVYDPAAP